MANYLPRWKSRIHASIYKRHSWRGTGIVQPQSWDQVSANNWLRSNASTEPVQISVLTWYLCPVPRQYRWTNFSRVTFRSRAGGRSCLCQNYASTAPVLQILLRYWRDTKSVVNFNLGTYSFKRSLNDGSFFFRKNISFLYLCVQGSSNMQSVTKHTLLFNFLGRNNWLRSEKNTFHSSINI